MHDHRQRWSRWLVSVLLLGVTAYAIAEELTLVTYYPSPRGVYKELQVQALTLSPPGNLTVSGSLAVGPTASLGNPGDVAVQGTVLITNADGVGPSLSAELGNGQFFNVTPQGIGVGGAPEDFTGPPSDQTFTLHGGDHATLLLKAGDAVLGGIAAALTPIGPVPPGLALGTASAHPVNVVTDFQPRLTVTADGDVGIGTSTPSATLEIQHEGLATATGTGIMTLRNSAGEIVFNAALFPLNTAKFGVGIRGAAQAPIPLTIYTNTGVALKLQSTDPVSGGGGPRIVFHKPPTTLNPNVLVGMLGYSGKVELASLGAPLQLRVNEGSPILYMHLNGNVGIGTVSPQSTLHVAGNYLQIPDVSKAPPYADCNSAAEAGRMVVRTGSMYTRGLYVCLGSGGWQKVD